MNVAPRPPRTSISVCAGVGGLDLGLTNACGVEPVVYIEREAFAAAVLVARMEEAKLASAPVWDDVCTFDARPWRGLEEHRARISASPENVLGWMARAPNSSSSMSALLSSVRPRSSSGRTSPEQLGPFHASVSTSRNEATEEPGPSFERVTLEPLTSAPESFCWPTPRASPNENRTTTNAPSHGNGHGETLAGTACDWGRENLWPTASALDWKSGEASQATLDRNSRPLNEVATDWARSHLAAMTSKDGPECLQYDPTLHRLSLNPAFVEWLMGWSDGHAMPYALTASEPAETESFQLRPHTLGGGFGTISLDELTEAA